MSLLRRRLMADMPKTELKGNVVKVVLNVSVEDTGNAPIFGADFDISQVKYIRYIDADIELDVGYTLDLNAGEYHLEIGLNELTNGDWMFYLINIQSCDFSDVDISKMRSGRYMFAYTAIEKPPFVSLPNVTLTPNCFESMFEGCGLIYAPVLPSKNLIDGCYKNMFNGCTDLIFIKALFESNPNDYPTATENWTLNVASEGTFVMSKDASFSESEFRGISGIPEQWSVVSSDELVNGKVVNGLSFYYTYASFLGLYKTTLESQYLVTSEIGSVYRAYGDEYEEVIDAATIKLGESSSVARYFLSVPVIDIVYGPKEDDCFIYELPDASDDKELILFEVNVNDIDILIFAEKGMTWGDFVDSRYAEIAPFYSDGIYIRYQTTDYLYHGDYEKVKIEDLIDTEKYYFVESES